MTVQVAVPPLAIVAGEHAIDDGTGVSLSAVRSGSLIAGAALKTGVPKVLFQVREPYPCSVTGDGKRFIFLEPADEPRTPFMVVLNWAAGLKR